MKIRLPIIIGLSVLILGSLTLGLMRAWPEDTQKVIFENGLLTVHAKEINLKSLIDEISKKLNIQVSIDPGIEDKTITVDFENQSLEQGLKTILQSASISDKAVVYKKTSEVGKPDQWVIEGVYLPEKSISEETKMQENEITEDAIIFYDEKGNIKQRVKLLKTIPGKSWSNVSESKNKKYIAINNIGVYDQKGEWIENAEMIMLNSQGEELWRMKHNLANIIPSPNGKYIVGVPDAAFGGAPISMFNEKGLIKEIAKDDRAWNVDFSKDGSFFAVTVVTYDKIKKGSEKYQGHLIVLDEEGNELWRKKNITIGDSSFSEVNITDDDTVSLTTGLPERKVYRFDKEGDPI